LEAVQPLGKMRLHHHLISAFYKQVAEPFVGYSLSPCYFGELLFFPHQRPKKRSKRTPLLLPTDKTTFFHEVAKKKVAKKPKIVIEV
jgi:hypothetical protein